MITWTPTQQELIISGYRAADLDYKLVNVVPKVDVERYIRDADYHRGLTEHFFDGRINAIHVYWFWQGYKRWWESR